MVDTKWAVEKKSPPPLSIPLPQEILDRIQVSARTLNLSASAATACALECVVDKLSAGWRPENLPPTGTTFLAVRLNVDLKAKLDAVALSAGIKLSEICRVAVWSALYKMEGCEQVLWPFRLRETELVKVVRMYTKTTWGS